VDLRTTLFYTLHIAVNTENLFFYVLLTVYLGIIFVNNQLDAQFFFMYVYFYSLLISGSHVPIIGGTRWRSWLRHCATSCKDAGSIPVDVIEGFHWHNSSSRTMSLGLTQPLTEMSTRNVFWGGGGVKIGRGIGRPYLPPSCAYCLEIWQPEPPGSLRACQVCKGIALHLLS
jgi:hypothetical protein